MTYLLDKRLARAVLSGDASACKQFFDENYDRLYRFVLPLVGGQHASAEDVVQLSMTKCLKNLHTYRGDSQLFTWLCRIARNQAVDWRRSNARHVDNVLSVDTDQVVQRELHEQTVPVSDIPHEAAMYDEKIQSIHEALDRLPARYGDVLEWKYIYGMSAKEIAEKLEIGLEAVNSMLARAKRAFKDTYPRTDAHNVTSAGQEKQI